MAAKRYRNRLKLVLRGCYIDTIYNIYLYNFNLSECDTQRSIALLNWLTLGNNKDFSWNSIKAKFGANSIGDGGVL